MPDDDPGLLPATVGDICRLEAKLDELLTLLRTDGEAVPTEFEDERVLGRFTSSELEAELADRRESMRLSVALKTDGNREWPDHPWCGPINDPNERKPSDMDRLRESLLAQADDKAGVKRAVAALERMGDTQEVNLDKVPEELRPDVRAAIARYERKAVNFKPYDHEAEGKPGTFTASPIHDPNGGRR